MNDNTSRITDISSTAAALFDGGWRPEDREQMIEELQITEAEADAIIDHFKSYMGT